MLSHPRLGTECLACDQERPDAAFLEHRQISRAVVSEGGIGFFVLLRQGYPRLDPIHAVTFPASPLEALRMRDPAARRHPIDFPRPDRLFGAQAVAMHDLTID